MARQVYLPVVVEEAGPQKLAVMGRESAAMAVAAVVVTTVHLLDRMALTLAWMALEANPAWTTLAVAEAARPTALAQTQI